MYKGLSIIIVLLGIFTITPSLLHAQEESFESIDEAFESLNPLVPPPTRSPRSTLRSFLTSTEQAINTIKTIYDEGQAEGGLSYTEEQLSRAADAQELIERAVRSLNLSDVPDAHRERIGLNRTLMLREIFNRIETPDIESAPGLYTQGKDGERTINTDLPKRWEIPGTEIAIELGKEGKYVREYLFSIDTVTEIPQFYKDVHSVPSRPSVEHPDFYHFYTSTPGTLLPYKWSSKLPSWSKDKLYIDQTPWQWFGLFSLLALLILAIKLLFKWYFRRTRSQEYHATDILIISLVIVFIWSGLYAIEHFLNITSHVFEFVSFVLTAVMFITASWLAFVTVNYVGDLIWRTSSIVSLIDRSVINTLMRLVSLVAASTVLYYGAVYLGVPITPIVAGFGALGLAIGIGAQEYFKNVIGGITLFLDRTVRVGESCEFQGIIGSVEEIGLRSTKIRTSDKRLVTVPNAVFSTASITNYTRNSGRVISKTFGLVYETDQDQLRQVLDQLSTYLDEHELVDSHRVKLIDLADFSLNIGAKITLQPEASREYFQFQEEFLFKSMEIVKSCGTSFAFPSQTVYVAGAIPKPQETS